MQFPFFSSYRAMGCISLFVTSCLSKKGQDLVPTVTWVPFHRYTVQFMLRRYEIIQKADGLIFGWGEAEVNKIAFDFSSKNYDTHKPHLSKHRNYLFLRWRLVKTLSELAD